MNDLNEALFLNAAFFSTLSFSFAAAARISVVPFTKLFALIHYNHINMIVTLKFSTTFFLTEYWPLDKSLTSIHFLS